MARNISLIAMVVLAMAGGGYWFIQNNTTASLPAVKPSMPVPVVVAIAEKKDVPLLLTVVGRGEAYESVTVRSRVDGLVTAVPFNEGQRVNKGQVLVTLDSADFAAKQRQAEANLARDEALLAKAKADVINYQSLKNQGFVSEEKVNDLRTIEQSAQANVRADRAALDWAVLQTAYTTIRAPFDGLVGSKLVAPGASVKTNDTTLVVINRIQPLYINFAIPEKYLNQIRQQMQLKGDVDVLITPRSTVNNVPPEPIKAKAKFLDNTVDIATGTLTVRAILPNQDSAFMPGQFLNVQWISNEIKDAIVVPIEAVQQGANGPIIFVVNSDKTVSIRKIEILERQPPMAIISKGIEAGERVVIDGQMRLTPGAKVEIKTPSSEKNTKK